MLSAYPHKVALSLSVSVSVSLFFCFIWGGDCLSFRFQGQFPRVWHRAKKRAMNACSRQERQRIPGAVEVVIALQGDRPPQGWVRPGSLSMHRAHTGGRLIRTTRI